jgi:hypothetical protein
MYLELINIFYLQRHFSYIIYTTHALNSPCLCTIFIQTQLSCIIYTTHAPNFPYLCIIYIQTRISWSSLKSCYKPFRFIRCSPSPLHPTLTFQSRKPIGKQLLLYLQYQLPQRVRILGMKPP